MVPTLMATAHNNGQAELVPRSLLSGDYEGGALGGKLCGNLYGSGPHLGTHQLVHMNKQVAQLGQRLNLFPGALDVLGKYKP